MNDYQMMHLAADRRHELAREAAQARLAREAAAGHRDHGRPDRAASRPRSTLRLTLEHLLGRAAG